jgi:hypothetical protein
MGFLDKVKQQAEQAAERAREGVADVQTKRELSQAYTELGEKAYDLASSGAISNPALDPIVERIRSLKAKLEEGGTAAAAAPETETPPASAVADTPTTEAPASNQPPAMPS